MPGVRSRIGVWFGLPLVAPDSVPLPDNETLGAIAVDLAWRWPSWVNRRVETIEFVEDTTVRRSMSVDFTFPKVQDLAAPISPGAKIFVPLQILAKETLMHVDVVDEHRASLSTLNTASNADLSARGLVRLLDAFHRTEHGTPLPAEVAGDLRFLASAGPEAARERFKELFVRGTSLAKLLDYAVDDPDLDGQMPARPELQMINDLALGFLQLVQITYEPGLHRVLKVAYDVPQAW